VVGRENHRRSSPKIRKRAFFLSSSFQRRATMSFLYPIIPRCTSFRIVRTLSTTCNGTAAKVAQLSRIDNLLNLGRKFCSLYCAGRTQLIPDASPLSNASHI
jgi:hypothetical protein